MHPVACRSTLRRGVGAWFQLQHSALRGHRSFVGTSAEDAQRALPSSRAGWGRGKEIYRTFIVQKRHALFLSLRENGTPLLLLLLGPWMVQARTACGELKTLGACDALPGTAKLREELSSGAWLKRMNSVSSSCSRMVQNFNLHSRSILFLLQSV
jgi:hypothetical protein